MSVNDFWDWYYYHINTLVLACWTLPPSAEPMRGDPPNEAERFDEPFFFSGVNEIEPHRLWLAKRIVPFFSTSLFLRSS
jgi:hypothetical protein